MKHAPAIGKAVLIDDEKFDHMIYDRIFKRSGLVGKAFSFQYAEDALEFLKSNDEGMIDVIFLDINMPKMNGFEFLEAASTQLQGGFAKAVVIMLTTSLDPRDSERARQYEVVKLYVNKPLTVEDLSRAAEIVGEYRDPPGTVAGMKNRARRDPGP